MCAEIIDSRKGLDADDFHCCNLISNLEEKIHLSILTSCTADASTVLVRLVAVLKTILTGWGKTNRLHFRANN